MELLGWLLLTILGTGAILTCLFRISSDTWDEAVKRTFDILREFMEELVGVPRKTEKLLRLHTPEFSQALAKILEQYSALEPDLTEYTQQFADVTCGTFSYLKIEFVGDSKKLKYFTIKLEALAQKHLRETGESYRTVVEVERKGELHYLVLLYYAVGSKQIAALDEWYEKTYRKSALQRALERAGEVRDPELHDEKKNG